MSNKEENKAIVNKIEKILNNTGYVDYARIVIETSREEVTTIQYSIKEVITPDTAKDKEGS